MAHAWAIPVGLVHDHLDRAVSGFRKNLQSVCVCVCVCVCVNMSNAHCLTAPPHHSSGGAQAIVLRYGAVETQAPSGSQPTRTRQDI